MIRLAHQAAACIVLRDLGHGATHVHVDNVRAQPFHYLRGISHLLRIAAENLDRDGALFFGVFGVLERAIDAAHEAIGTDHLGDDEPAASVALDETAKRRIRHAGHGRHDERRLQGNSADLHAEMIMARLSLASPGMTQLEMCTANTA